MTRVCYKLLGRDEKQNMKRNDAIEENFMHKFIRSKIRIERQGEWLFHAGIFYLLQIDRKGR